MTSPHLRKKARYIEHRARGATPQQAAVLAGYASDARVTVWRLEKDDDVREAIAKASVDPHGPIQGKGLMSREEYGVLLTAISRDERLGINSRLMALKLLGDHLGFNDKSLSPAAITINLGTIEKAF